MALLENNSNTKGIYEQQTEKYNNNKNTNISQEAGNWLILLLADQYKADNFFFFVGFDWVIYNEAGDLSPL